MLLDIKVTGAAPAAVASGDHATGDHPAGSSGDSAVIDFAATPEADWQPYDATLEPAPGATNHEITLHATETVKEVAPGRSEEHTSELQSLMRISYAVFCLKKQKQQSSYDLDH